MEHVPGPAPPMEASIAVQVKPVDNFHLGHDTLIHIKTTKT
jgi:hypothetical protein